MPNMQPSRSQVHVDSILTNIAVAYTEAGNFVADQVFPNVPVAKQSDLYFQYTKEDWIRSQAEKRAPATESVGSGWNLTTDSYFCDVYAIHKDVDDQTRANQDNPINLDRDASRWVTRQILLKRETEFASTYMATGVWDNDLDGVTAGPGSNQFLRWDEDGSDPVGDVTSNKITVQENTGYDPQVGVAQPHVMQALRQHPDLIDRIKFTQQGFVSNQLIASAFDLDNLLVASGIEDTSTEGASTASTGFITGKHFLLVYRAPSPSLFEPSGGYTFVWTGLIGASKGWRIKRFRMENLESDRVEGEIAFDQKVVASDVGVFFEDAVS